MSYSVKEIFYSLQGEGARTGRPAVFCRFSGCNLWSGREQDRATAVCNFCDTEFIGIDGAGGGKFSSAEQLASSLKQYWPDSHPLTRPYVVCTGGEPALQLDQALIRALHEVGFEIAVETNGTLALPMDIDWVCVSPKADTEIVVRQGQELKLIYPQPSVDPAQFEHLEFDYFYLQPMYNSQLSENTHKAINYCLQHPQWSLSLQTHKMIGIP